MDAMVVHHGLEASPDPRSALRECARVLTGGGRLVICAFNPLSLWGLRALYARAVEDSFSHLKLVSPLRLLDWLAVLGFEAEPVQYLAYNLPLTKSGSDAAFWRGSRNLLARYRVPVGGVYILSAVKTAFAIRPDKFRAKVAGAKLAPVAYPKISSRSRFEKPGATTTRLITDTRGN
jgi:SAM-dependent methyltransferase